MRSVRYDKCQIHLPCMISSPAASKIGSLIGVETLRAVRNRGNIFRKALLMRDKMAAIFLTTLSISFSKENCISILISLKFVPKGWFWTISHHFWRWPKNGRFGSKFGHIGQNCAWWLQNGRSLWFLSIIKKNTQFTSWESSEIPSAGIQCLRHIWCMHQKWCVDMSYFAGHCPNQFWLVFMNLLTFQGVYLTNGI